MSESESEIMTADDVARWLRMHRNSVYAAAVRGEIPHRRIGRRLIFSRAALEAWLSSEPRVRRG
jgi:excisionase family DNA binding protein